MTSAEINALPEKARAYIHLLETSHGNEAHILQDNWRLTQENQQLRALIGELTQSSKPGSD
jgi:hypothetical protein